MPSTTRRSNDGPNAATAASAHHHLEARIRPRVVSVSRLLPAGLEGLPAIALVLVLRVETTEAELLVLAARHLLRGVCRFARIYGASFLAPPSISGAMVRVETERLR